MLDISLKLSGMKALAYEKLATGWNILIEFNEKRPVKANPQYPNTVLGKIALQCSKLCDTRLDKAREVVFFPFLSKLTAGYDNYTVLDRGSYTVKGFSKFFKQTEYRTMFNSPRQAYKDGSFEYKCKVSDKYNTNTFKVIQKENVQKHVKKIEYSIKHPFFGRGTKDVNFKLIDDIENDIAPEKIDLESIYPLRYMVLNGQWVPQLVFNLNNLYKANDGAPIDKDKIKLGKIIPTVSGERAGISGVWSPVNASNKHPDKLKWSKKKDNLVWTPGQNVITKGSMYMPKHLMPQETIEDLQLANIENDKADYQAQRGFKEAKIESFNPPRIVQK